MNRERIIRIYRCINCPYCIMDSGEQNKAFMDTEGKDKYRFWCSDLSSYLEVTANEIHPECMLEESKKS